MKLALIISAIIASIQSISTTTTTHYPQTTMAVSNVTSINANTISPTTVSTLIYSTPITSEMIDTTSTANMPTSSMIYPSSTNMPTSSTMHPNTTKMAPTTMMPYPKNISCFSNEYIMESLNATAVRNQLKTMIDDIGNYTKDFYNTDMKNPLRCGTEVYHNTTSDTYLVRYSAFNKMVCNAHSLSNIICNNTKLCNKVVNCCQDKSTLLDDNCNTFFITSVNDTRNSCMGDSSSECYSLARMDITPTATTTKVNAANLISALKLYLLILISAAAPAININ
jgi:hypothetical protein